MLEKAKKAVATYLDNLRAEVDAVMERDPAATSRLEVMTLYSGFKAVRSYRRAHWFHEHNMKFIARAISQNARSRTGVEIHPGAKIGKGLFIDHGMGVVIGETTVIGDNCTLYQNVTLGGTGKDTGKRHPTLGNNVLVGSGAKVLGPFTVGDGARVAAGAVVLDEVPENATAVGVPAKVVRVNGIKPDYSFELDQVHVDDPVAMELARVNEECEQLKAQLAAIQAQLTAVTATLSVPQQAAVETATSKAVIAAMVPITEAVPAVTEPASAAQYSKPKKCIRYIPKKPAKKPAPKKPAPKFIRTAPTVSRPSVFKALPQKTSVKKR